MSSADVVLVGHSHLVVLQTSEQEKQSIDTPRVTKHFMQLWGGAYDPFSNWQNGELKYHDRLEADLLDLVAKTKASAIFTSFIGAEPTIWSIQGNNRPFDIIIPGVKELPQIPGATLIPYRLFREFVWASLFPVLTFNSRIKNLTDLPVYQVFPPPPVSSLERLVNFGH